MSRKIEIVVTQRDCARTGLPPQAAFVKLLTDAGFVFENAFEIERPKLVGRHLIEKDRFGQFMAVTQWFEDEALAA